MPSPESVHISVLLNEAVDALAPKAGGRYLDGTVGMGGHSFAIMERTGGEGFLCGLDRDRQALELARIRLAPFGDRVHLVHTRYSEFEAALDGIGIGLGFTLSLTLLGAVREALGNGSVFGLKFIQGDGILLFILAPGAFMVLAYLMAIFKKLTAKTK